ncbi:MAG: dihydroorotase [Chitinophagaceae bacterium]
MKILIKQGRIIDPSSALNGQLADIFIENGVIARIGQDLTVDANQVVKLDGAFVSPGWVDVFAQFGDPGLEYKETLETGAAAAAAGGYTDVLVIPNTNPCIHNKAAVEYIVQKSKMLPARVHPIGAVTRQTEGKELAEMYDMRQSGALAFSDGTSPIQSAGLLVKALQYVKAFDGILIQVPDDKSINPHGLMHEGIVSTQLGLPGKPAMAEELMVARDIELLRYADSRLHFTGIASAQSLNSIRKAKEEGLKVSCSVSPAHLFFTDADLVNYNSNLKINPPLRLQADREALRRGVLDGSIDCIASHHQPHEYDSKVLEFEYAKYGMISLETAFAALNTAMPGTDPEVWVRLLAVNPRRLFGLPAASIEAGQPASLTFFEQSGEWTVTEKELRSKSRNTPFLGLDLTGRVLGTLNQSNIYINS